MDVPEHARKGKSTNPTSVSPLLLIRDIAGERQVSLNGDSVSIGRSRDNDVEIEDISSSRHHCALKRIQGCWHIEDLRSRNGTLVNGILIRRQPMMVGDLIEIGALELRLKISAGSSEGDCIRCGEAVPSIPASVAVMHAVTQVQ